MLPIRNPKTRNRKSQFWSSYVRFSVARPTAQIPNARRALAAIAESETGGGEDSGCARSIATNSSGAHSIAAAAANCGQNAGGAAQKR